jgi:hypothetical protein
MMLQTTRKHPGQSFWFPLELKDNPLSGKFKAKQALSCGICGMKYQLVDNIELFRAATASGGDLVEFFTDRDELPR